MAGAKRQCRHGKMSIVGGLLLGLAVVIADALFHAAECRPFQSADEQARHQYPRRGRQRRQVVGHRGINILFILAARTERGLSSGRSPRSRFWITQLPSISTHSTSAGKSTAHGEIARARARRLSRRRQAFPLLTAKDVKEQQFGQLAQGDAVPFKYDFVVHVWDASEGGLISKTRQIEAAFSQMEEAQCWTSNVYVPRLPRRTSGFRHGRAGYGELTITMPIRASTNGSPYASALLHLHGAPRRRRSPLRWIKSQSDRCSQFSFPARRNSRSCSG